MSLHLIQLTDLLLGALTYKHRGLHENSAKLSVINLIETKLRYPLTLTKSTPLTEAKFNLFLFNPKQTNGYQ